MINSTLWVIAIAVGAVIVAIANIQYNRARESENKKEMATQALLILMPELERNQKTLIKLRETIPKNQVPLEAFDTAAWQTVSNGELLLGLSGELLPDLMQVYNLMNRVNGMHSRLLEMSIGVTSALSGNESNKALLKSNLLAVLGELEPILQKVVTQKNTSPGISSS